MKKLIQVYSNAWVIIYYEKTEKFPKRLFQVALKLIKCSKIPGHSFNIRLTVDSGEKRDVLFQVSHFFVFELGILYGVDFGAVPDLLQLSLQISLSP